MSGGVYVYRLECVMIDVFLPVCLFLHGLGFQGEAVFLLFFPLTLISQSGLEKLSMEDFVLTHDDNDE